MQLEDLKVGEEYYTARADIWATGQLGGRMRLLSLEPEPHPPGGTFLRCDRLDPHTGTVWREVTTDLSSIHGTWAEVGAPLLARHDACEAWAQEVNARYREALELAVGTLRNCGVTARLMTRHGAQREQYTIEIAPTFPAMLGGLFATKE
jgi:hypothetical protein